MTVCPSKMQEYYLGSDDYQSVKGISYSNVWFNNCYWSIHTVECFSVHFAFCKFKNSGVRVFNLD